MRSSRRAVVIIARVALSWRNQIRDYFGEDTGLYYAWLGHYAASLFICMLMGCITMIAQYHYGSVERNPLTSGCTPAGLRGQGGQGFFFGAPLEAAPGPP